jgi:hypothetical protein
MQNIEAGFAALRANTSVLAERGARERADRLRSMVAAVLANKKRFYEAAYTELKACDLDVAAQLVMLKGATSGASASDASS